MPSAWDILKIRRERVLVVLIQPPELRFSRPWSLMWRQLQLPAESNHVDVRGLPYDAARNKGLLIAKENGFGYLFFLDSDTIPPPEIVPTLIATGRDLIGGFYRRRGLPFDPSAALLVHTPNNEIVRAPLPSYTPGEIIPVDCLPTGAMLMSRRCVEALLQAYPLPFEWGWDIVLRKGQDGNVLPQWSEDYIMSIRAKAIGFQPWLHTGMVCKHEFSVSIDNEGLKDEEGKLIAKL